MQKNKLLTYKFAQSAEDPTIAAAYEQISKTTADKMSEISSDIIAKLTPQQLKTLDPAQKKSIYDNIDQKSKLTVDQLAAIALPAASDPVEEAKRSAEAAKKKRDTSTGTSATPAKPATVKEEDQPKYSENLIPNVKRMQTEILRFSDIMVEAGMHKLPSTDLKVKERADVSLGQFIRSQIVPQVASEAMMKSYGLGKEPERLKLKPTDNFFELLDSLKRVGYGGTDIVDGTWGFRTQTAIKIAKEICISIKQLTDDMGYRKFNVDLNPFNLIPNVNDPNKEIKNKVYLANRAKQIAECLEDFNDKFQQFKQWLREQFPQLSEDPAKKFVPFGVQGLDEYTDFTTEGFDYNENARYDNIKNEIIPIEYGNRKINLTLDNLKNYASLRQNLISQKILTEQNADNWLAQNLNTLSTIAKEQIIKYFEEKYITPVKKRKDEIKSELEKKLQEILKTYNSLSKDDPQRKNLSSSYRKIKELIDKIYQIPLDTLETMNMMDPASVPEYKEKIEATEPDQFGP